MSDTPPPFFETPTGKPGLRRFWRFFAKPWVILLLVFAVLATVVGFSVNRIMLSLLHSKPEVVVPKLEGRTLFDALASVSPLGLSIQQEGTEFDESLPAGTILRQNPPSGMQVRAGRAIRVVISKGGQIVFVPAVTGKLLAEAQSILASNGMQMGAVSETYSTDSPKDTVLDQHPSSGTVATRGALIDVEVSKGAPPAGVPIMPDFTGKTAEEAHQWAAQNAAVIDTKEDPNAVGAAGTVVRQSPKPGQPLLDGQSGQIVIVPATGASSSKRFTYQVPADAGSEVTVRIMARDEHGETKVYEARHPAGARVEIPVAVNATTRLRVYVDDVLKDEKVIEP